MMGSDGHESISHPDTSPPSAASWIEAVLFVSPRPVALSTILQITALSEDEAQAALIKLKERYSPRSSGIVLREVAGGLQLVTNPLCSAIVERFREEARPAPLSGAAHEVLSCVLYLGPLTRAAINAARGVNSDAVVRNLLDRNLLAETGRDQTSPGAPALLDVTEDFLLAAGARDRKDFPALEEIVEPAEVSRVRERIKGQESERPNSDKSHYNSEGG